MARRREERNKERKKERKCIHFGERNEMNDRKTISDVWREGGRGREGGREGGRDGGREGGREG